MVGTMRRRSGSRRSPILTIVKCGTDEYYKKDVMNYLVQHI